MRYTHDILKFPKFTEIDFFIRWANLIFYLFFHNKLIFTSCELKILNENSLKNNLNTMHSNKGSLYTFPLNYCHFLLSVLGKVTEKFSTAHFSATWTIIIYHRKCGSQQMKSSEYSSFMLSIYGTHLSKFRQDCKCCSEYFQILRQSIAHPLPNEFSSNGILMSMLIHTIPMLIIFC